MNPLDLQGALPDKYAVLIFIVPMAVYAFVTLFAVMRSVLKD